MKSNRPLLATPIVLAWLSGCAAMPEPPDVAGLADASLGGRPAIELKLVEQPIDADAPTGDSLPLSEALSRCLAHSGDLQASLARVSRAYAESHQERLLPNPVLTLALRFPESSANPIIEAGLAADLMTALRAPWRASAADQRLRVATQEALAATLDAALALQRCYLDAQAYDAAAGLLASRRELAERLITLARARLRSGEGTQADVDAAETEAAAMEAEADDLELRRRQTRLRLTRLIARPSDPTQWRLDPLPQAPPAIADEKAWIAAAMEHRPEIAAGRWELAALGVEDRLTRLALLEGTEPGIASERDGEWSLGPALAAPLPLFDWGQAKREAVKAKRIETMHRLTQTRREVIEEVRAAWAGVQSSRAALRRVETSWMPTLDRRSRSAEAAARAGHTDITPVLLARDAQRSALARQLELQKGAADALLLLHRAVGGVAHAPAPTPATRPAFPAR